MLIVSAGATAQATLAADWVATSGSSNVGVAQLSAGGFDVSLSAALGTAGWNVSNAGNASAVILTDTARADVLTGGPGADTLIGVGGTDLLASGLGADSFIFGSASDAMGDEITGYSAAQGDKPDFRPMGANTALDGDQALTYPGGGASTGTAGQLRFAGGVVEGDVNGDRVADFAIQLAGVAALATGSLWLSQHPASEARERQSHLDRDAGQTLPCRSTLLRRRMFDERALLRPTIPSSGGG